MGLVNKGGVGIKDFLLFLFGCCGDKCGRGKSYSTRVFVVRLGGELVLR